MWSILISLLFNASLHPRWWTLDKIHNFMRKMGNAGKCKSCTKWRFSNICLVTKFEGYGRETPLNLRIFLVTFSVRDGKYGLITQYVQNIFYVKWAFSLISRAVNAGKLSSFWKTSSFALIGMSKVAQICFICEMLKVVIINMHDVKE